MSDRGNLTGAAPKAGIYEARPVPADVEDLGVFINDELLHLGGIVNGVLEGGAFPPQSKLPLRWRNGMMVYFVQAIPDTYKVGLYTGDQIITSAGIWLYREIQDPTYGKVSKWWKVIDDPSELDIQFFVYQLGDENIPSTPPSGTNNPPLGWASTPPQKNNKGEYIWASGMIQSDIDGTLHWGSPTIWSGGVEDGNDGDTGAPGLDGRLFETWFLESSSQPLPPSNEYPPTGGWVSTTPETPTNSVWSSFILVAEDGTSPDYPWSYPIKVSGIDGEDGQDGFDGLQGRQYNYFYQEGATTPSVPPSGTYPPVGWVTEAPSNPTDSVWQTFIVTEADESDPSYPYGYPLKVSGTDGEDGQDGIDGENGSDGRRGTLNVNASGTAWDNQTAYDAIANDPNGDGNVYPWDTVTIIDEPTEFSEMRYYNGGGNPGIWTSLALFVHGDQIVTGTILGNKLLAKTITAAQISADTITANEIVSQTITANEIATNTITATQIDAQTITSAEIATGTITANEIDALTITADEIASNAITTDKIDAGAVTATEISAGTITGNEINAGTTITIGGGAPDNQDVVILSASDPDSRIWVGNTDGGAAKFRVDPNGNMYANSATLSDGTIENGSVVGSSIYIPNNTSPVFSVDAAGNMTANSGTFGGTIEASQIVGDIVSGITKTVTPLQEYISVSYYPTFTRMSNPLGSFTVNTARNWDRTLVVTTHIRLIENSGESYSHGIMRLVAVASSGGTTTTSREFHGAQKESSTSRDYELGVDVTMSLPVPAGTTPTYSFWGEGCDKAGRSYNWDMAIGAPSDNNAWTALLISDGGDLS